MSLSPLSPSAELLVHALRRLPSRSAQLLTFRFVDGLGVDGTAAAYGISREVVPVHTLRAARLLGVALQGSEDARPIRPLDVRTLPDAEEARLATRLEAELSQRTSNEEAAAADVQALALPLRALAVHRQDVRRLGEEVEATHRASPAQRRADLLRRAAVLALVALALWLYLRYPTAPK